MGTWLLSRCQRPLAETPAVAANGAAWVVRVLIGGRSMEEGGEDRIAHCIHVTGMASYRLIVVPGEFDGRGRPGSDRGDQTHKHNFLRSSGSNPRLHGRSEKRGHCLPPWIPGILLVYIYYISVNVGPDGRPNKWIFFNGNNNNPNWTRQVPVSSY